MSVTLPLGSRGVVLDLEIPGEGATPRLGGFLLSLVRNSGAFESGYIEVSAAGISRPFAGATWEAEWGDVEGLRRLRVGIPDAIFAVSFDAVARFSVEAITGTDTRATGFGELAVTLFPPALQGDKEWPAWLPGELIPSFRNSGL